MLQSTSSACHGIGERVLAVEGVQGELNRGESALDALGSQRKRGKVEKERNLLSREEKMWFHPPIIDLWAGKTIGGRGGS